MMLLFMDTYHYPIYMLPEDKVYKGLKKKK